MADRIAVLRDGKIVQYAAPQDLYIRPADPALARFVGDANLLDGQLARARTAAERRVSTPSLAGCRSTSTSALAASSGPVTVLIRPEQLEIMAAPPAGANGAQPDCLAGSRRRLRVLRT